MSPTPEESPPVGAPGGEAGSAADELGTTGRAFHRLGRRLLVPALLGLAVLIGLALVSDARELREQLVRFDLVLLLPVLALSLVNYGLRFWRWEIYLRDLSVRLPLPTSLAIFLVGFLLSVTPGKVGELGKAWLARELGGGEARRTVAVVVAERLTDLVGMLLLIALGASTLPRGAWIAAGCLLLALLPPLLLGWERGSRRLLAILRQAPGLGPRLALVEEVYDHLRRLLRPALLLPALLLSVLAWGAEGVGFYLVIRSYGAAASLLSGVLTYSLSTLVGALSMLPGGLLAAEGSLTLLLGLQGLATPAAASATLVIRAATLWFAVLLGLVALPYALAALGRRKP